MSSAPLPPSTPRLSPPPVAAPGYAPAWVPPLQQPTPVVPLDDNGLIAGDLPCRNCTYNLRGLPSNSRCPECGRAIGLSLMGDLLRFSDPNWLVTLRRGVNCILVGIAMMVGLFIYSRLPGNARNARTDLGNIQTLLQLATQAVFFIGGWFLTTPDPSGIGEDQYGTSRKVIRVALLLSIAGPLFNLSLESGWITFSNVDLILVVALLISLTSLVGQVAQLNYLGKIALRIPDGKLSSRFKFLVWAIGLSYGGLQAEIFYFAFAVRFAAAGGGWAALNLLTQMQWILGITGLALLVFGIMYLLMLERLGKAFKEQERFGRQTWAAQAAAAA